MKKKKKSQIKIEKVFINLIQKYELEEIKVKDICNLANINRTTFYNNYLDIYDLADSIKESMYKDLLELYKEEAITKKHSYDFLKLFNHIKENQIYYKTMFKLKFDFMDYCNNPHDNMDAIKYLGTLNNLEYHIEFFKAGINAIIQKWLYNGCIETPLEMANIIKKEYQQRIK